MTGPRGDMSPIVGGLGAKVVKDAPKPTATAPAPSIDPGKFIEVDPMGRLRTNDPRNEAANVAPGKPIDWEDVS